MRATLLITVLAAFAAAQGASKTELAKRLTQRKIERFFGKIDARALDAGTRQRIERLKQGAKLGGEYGCIHQTLLLLHPEYKRADALLLSDRFAAAAEQFGALRKAGDEYLKAYTTFRYGLAEMNRERFDAAGAAFTAVLNEYGRYVGCDIEAAFYLAVCLGQDRQKERAIVAAQRFLDDYPDAPDRYRKAMEQMKNELVQGWESPLYDLSGRMQKVARRIDGGETGAPTQNEQKEIVRIIEELIKKAKDNEGDGQGKGDGNGTPRGSDPSANPANRSSAPRGAAETGDLRPRPKRKAGAKWGEMRDKERDEVLQALKEKIPERYRELEEQYKKALAEGKRVTEPTEEGAGGK